MPPSIDLVAALLARLREVSGLPEPEAAARFADVLDSMGFVEFLTLVAEDCGVPVETIEQATGRRYGTVAEMTTALAAAGLRPVGHYQATAEMRTEPVRSVLPQAWLSATTMGLPIRRQSASAINALLRRPRCWLEDHAGIEARCLWDGEDALEVAARAGRAALQKAGLSAGDSIALLVTSEAPPLPIGLGAALHHRLGLPPGAAAIELGGTCTGFLTALWTAQRLLVDTDAVLILAIEAPSHWLSVRPGAAGEAAALFGDASAACVLTAHPTTRDALCLRDILLATDGAAGALLHVERESGGMEIHMDGIPLAQRTVRTMADTVRQMSQRHRLRPEQLAAVVAHGGNGRMPALLARRLGLPVECVWSETSRTGNLGSASLPIAWASHTEPAHGPTIWTAAGAGLQWGAALFDAPDSALGPVGETDDQEKDHTRPD
jgi:3-oxoacyl-[acyl-carrier-protein] synthase-3